MELWITGNGAKGHFANLILQKLVIESALGFGLDWQELPDALACRVASWYPEAPISKETRWPEYMDWMTQRLVKMDQVLRPTVKALP